MQSLRKLTGQSGAKGRREDILLDQMNRLAERGHKHFQWSVSVLLTLETALFFVRKEAAERAGLAPGEPFPIQRHLWGTVMMIIITAIFIIIAHTIYTSYEHYLIQLPNTLSTGVTRIPRHRLKSIIWLTLLLFPVFDLFVGLANIYSPLQHDPTFTPARQRGPTQKQGGSSDHIAWAVPFTKTYRLAEVRNTNVNINELNPPINQLGLCSLAGDPKQGHSDNFLGAGFPPLVWHFGFVESTNLGPSGCGSVSHWLRNGTSTLQEAHVPANPQPSHAKSLAKPHEVTVDGTSAGRTAKTARSGIVHHS